MDKAEFKRTDSTHDFKKDSLDDYKEEIPPLRKEDKNVIDEKSLSLDEKRDIRIKIRLGSTIKGHLAFAGAKVAAFFSAIGTSMMGTAFVVSVKPYELYERSFMLPDGQINKEVLEAGRGSLEPLNNVAFKILKQTPRSENTLGEKIAIRLDQGLGSILGVGLGALILPFVAAAQIIRAPIDGIIDIVKSMQEKKRLEEEKPHLEFRKDIEIEEDDEELEVQSQNISDHKTKNKSISDYSDMWNKKPEFDSSENEGFEDFEKEDQSFKQLNEKDGIKSPENEKKN